LLTQTAGDAEDLCALGVPVRFECRAEPAVSR
jgi:hypothetical protein